MHHKGLGIAFAAGREYGVTLPVTAAVVDRMFQDSKTRGRGDREHSAILTLTEGSSGHETGS